MNSNKASKLREEINYIANEIDQKTSGWLTEKTDLEIKEVNKLIEREKKLKLELYNLLEHF